MTTRAIAAAVALKRGTDETNSPAPKPAEKKPEKPAEKPKKK